ncbi:MAG: 1,4-dihydroxy-2-naphthoate octaprenyltransferase [Pseudomonadota bacterium]
MSSEDPIPASRTTGSAAGASTRPTQRLLTPGQGWQGIRPKTLPLAVVPVLLGGLLAWRATGQLNLPLLLVTLLTALLIQAGTNLFNDAKDGLRGNDGPERIGPTRLTSSGQATARQVMGSAWLLFGLALLGGLYLVLQGGPAILLLGLASLAAGWAYSGGPKPLSHTPWGEVFVIGFFGVAAVGGTYFLQAGDLPLPAILVGLALGVQAAAVLIVNNTRDRDGDAQAGRRTLALVLGRRGSGWAYAVMMLVPFPVLALALQSVGDATLALYWGALPFAIWLIWRFTAQHCGVGMNRQLALTALAQLLLGALLALTLLLPVD